DAAYILQKRPQLRAVRDIPPREQHTRVEAIRVAGGQVVNHAYFVPERDEPVGKRRTDETCAPRHEKTHGDFAPVRFDGGLRYRQRPFTRSWRRALHPL